MFARCKFAVFQAASHKPGIKAVAPRHHLYFLLMWRKSIPHRFFTVGLLFRSSLQNL